MFANTEKKLIDKVYFKVIRETEGFIEVTSKNIKHCWIIQKRRNKGKRKIYLYHKHSDKVEYYHQHNRIFTVGQAKDDIKGYDNYALELVLRKCSVEAIEYLKTHMK